MENLYWTKLNSKLIIFDMSHHESEQDLYFAVRHYISIKNALQNETVLLQDEMGKGRWYMQLFPFVASCFYMSLQ